VALVDDRIAKPVVGRFFPATAVELISRIEELGFAVHPHHRRLPLMMENSTVECDRGHQLCSFFRKTYLAVFSLPDAVSQPLAYKTLEVAFQHFRIIDHGPWLTVRPQQFVVYRAFLGPMGALSITQHVVSGVSRSYLQFRKAAHLSKSACSTRSHLELLNVAVA